MKFKNLLLAVGFSLVSFQVHADDLKDCTEELTAQYSDITTQIQTVRRVSVDYALGAMIGAGQIRGEALASARADIEKADQIYVVSFEKLGHLSVYVVPTDKACNSDSVWVAL